MRWLLLLVACRTPPLQELSFDFGATPACTTHTLETVALARLSALDPEPHLLGATVRILVGIPRRPCDVLGSLDVTVVLGDATDGVQLTAHVWRSSEDCGAAAVADRSVWLGPESGLSNTRLFVRDGAPGSTTSLTVTLQPQMAPSCNPPPPEISCTADCQCIKSNRCLQGGCIPPCSEDVDCAAGYRCQAGSLFCAPPVDPCCPGGCPFGQACTDCKCQPSASTKIATCACDADCGDGQLCSGGACLIPCASVFDCPVAAGQCSESRCVPTT